MNKIDEINHLLQEVDAWKRAAESERQKNIKLLAEIERKDEALRFYALESNYEEEFDGLIPVRDDAGDKARDAL